MIFLERFLRDESGQDLVEYGLLAALIVVVVIAAAGSIGPLVQIMYVRVQAVLP